MHYKNGKEAKNGDIAVGLDSSGNIVSGVLVIERDGDTTGMVRIVPMGAPRLPASDCIKAEDITELFAPPPPTGVPF